MSDNSNFDPAGKTVLITGGTGSFGKTMVMHLLEQGYEEIRIFSRDEWKQEDMRVRMKEPRLRFYIGDVRNRASVDGASRTEASSLLRVLSDAGRGDQHHWFQQRA